MSRFFACISFLFLGFFSFSQKAYFVYIQSETSDPFFVKVGEKTFSSSGGFVILPELKDSTYPVRVGFSQNKWPDQQFIVAIKSKDRGYLLKNFGDKGWGLFDLQTLAVQMAAQSNAGVKQRELREVSAFTSVLSKAANDPSLLYKPEFAVARTEIAARENRQPVPVPAPIRDTSSRKVTADTAVLVRNEPSAVPASAGALDNGKSPAETIDNAVKQPLVVSETGKSSRSADSSTSNTVAESQVPVSPVSPAVTAEEEPGFVRTRVIKKSESSTTEGFGLTFIDELQDGDPDTIQILIPNPPLELAAGSKQNDTRKFLDITDEERDGRPLGSKSVAKVSCNAMATASDFLKLRKKMAGQKSEDAMIEEAKKGFKAKCYSTDQIRNLGNLFLKEAGRFQFYEAVYPYSADRDNFVALQAEFKDNYFIHRFRNLVTPGNQ